MRRWTILLLGLVLAAAWYLLPTGSGGHGLRPATVPLQSAASTREPSELEEPGGDVDARSAAFPTGSTPARGPAVDEIDPATLVTRLTIHAFLPDGSPWTEGRLMLSANGQPLDFRRFPSSSGHLRRMGVQFRMSSGSLHTLHLVTDAEGKVALEHVTPELELSIQAVDVVGSVAASVEDFVLGPGEQRGVELWLDRHALPLRGRCVDESGVRLAGAKVSVSGRSVGFQRDADEDGEFEMYPFFDSTVTMRATLEDRIAVERVDVPANGSRIELVLRPGRSLVIETVDADGEPVSDVSIAAYDVGSDRHLQHSYARSGNVQVLSLLPHRPLVLRWGGYCAQESQAIDATVEHLRLVVPRPGELAIEVGPLPGGLEAVYAIDLICPGGDAQDWQAKGIQNTGHQQLTWRLFPGLYQLQILHLPAPGGDAWVPWGAPVEVEVFAGTTTIERLGG